MINLIKFSLVVFLALPNFAFAQSASLIAEFSKQISNDNQEVFADSCEGPIRDLDIGSKGTIKFTTVLNHTYTVKRSSNSQLILSVLVASYEFKKPICIKSSKDGEVSSVNLGSAKGNL